MTINLLGRPMAFGIVGLISYLLAMALLCALGFWQLDRAEQKRQLLLQQQVAMTGEVLDLNRIEIEDIDSVRYRPVKMAGHYDAAHQFLIDNQISEGKSGYLVLTPFIIDEGRRAILVNRGWLALGEDRSRLPALPVDTQHRQISGRLNSFPSVGLKLRGAEIPTVGWPSVVQLVESRILSEKLGYPLHEFQVELDAGQADGYQRQWKIAVPIPPEKHLAYAVQWFGLALTLTALFVWISLKKSQ